MTASGVGQNGAPDSQPLRAETPEAARPADPEASPGYPILFDLTADAKLVFPDNPRADLAAVIGFAVLGAILLVAGVLSVVGFDGGTTSTGIVLLIIGVGLLGATPLIVRAYRRGPIVGLRIDRDSVSFLRQRGMPATIVWTDPDLKFNIDEFLVSPYAVLPSRDARNVHPNWIELWRPTSRFLNLYTTFPPEAGARIVAEAQRHSVSVTTVQVAFFWHPLPKNPGFLDSTEAGSLRAGQTFNGRVTRIRGIHKMTDTTD